MQSQSKAQKIAAGFIRYLESSDQIDQLAELTRIQQKQSWAREDQNQAIITSAVDLKQKQKNELADYLTKQFRDKIKIKYQTNTSILGGLIIRVGNRIIDLSLKHRLEKLREQIAYD